MEGADIVQCELKYTNNVNVDKFVCNDRYGVKLNAPIFDTVRNTVDISTTITKKTVDQQTFATFVAVFDRPVNTGDDKDKSLVMGSQNPLIWAYGTKSGDVVNQHGDANYGATQIFYLTLPANAMQMFRTGILAMVMFATTCFIAF